MGNVSRETFGSSLREVAVYGVCLVREGICGRWPLKGVEGRLSGLERFGFPKGGSVFFWAGFAACLAGWSFGPFGERVSAFSGGCFVPSREWSSVPLKGWILFPQGKGFLFPQGNGFLLPRVDGLLFPQGNGFLFPQGNEFLFP